RPGAADGAARRRLRRFGGRFRESAQADLEPHAFDERAPQARVAAHQPFELDELLRGRGPVGVPRDDLFEAFGRHVQLTSLAASLPRTHSARVFRVRARSTWIEPACQASDWAMRSIPSRTLYRRSMTCRARAGSWSRHS